MVAEMAKHRGRVELAYGHADYDLMDLARVGDRLVPKRIDVYFPSADDLPELRMTIEVKGGVPKCVDVAISAKPDGREVRTVDLRAVRLEDWLEDIVAATSAEIVSTEGGLTTARVKVGEDAHRAAVSTIRAARQGSRRTVTDDLLQSVADVYRENINDRPVEAVQRAFGTSYRTAARYVQLARPRYLPATTPGKKKG